MRKNAVERAPVYTQSIEIKFIRSVVCGCKFSLGKRKKEGERVRQDEKANWCRPIKMFATGVTLGAQSFPYRWLN